MGIGFLFKPIGMLLSGNFRGLFSFLLGLALGAAGGFADLRGRICRDGRAESSLDRPSTNQRMCRPEMLRAMTSCWISEVPSKIV